MREIEEAIRRFHEKYYPEGIVEFLGKSDDGKMAFEFSGHICLTCGVEDYFEDFRIILSEATGRDLEIIKKEPLDEENTAWLVIYGPPGQGKEEYKMRYLVIDPEKGKEEEVVVTD